MGQNKEFKMENAFNVERKLAISLCMDLECGYYYFMFLIFNACRNFNTIVDMASNIVLLTYLKVAWKNNMHMMRYYVIHLALYIYTDIR